MQASHALHEAELLNRLLADYDIMERPVLNVSDPVYMKLGIGLNQILHLVSWGPDSIQAS